MANHFPTEIMEPTICIENQTIPEQKTKRGRGRPKKITIETPQPKSNKTEEVLEATKTDFSVSSSL